MTVVALGNLISQAEPDRVGDREVPILSMTMREGLVDQASKFKKRVASEDLSTYKAVQRGQLVVGFPIDEGVLAFQRLHDLGAVSPAYGIWDLVDPSVIDPDYLERFLRGPVALTFYASKLRSTTARRRSLPRETFLELPVPLPPLEEQRRVAAVLDQADALRRLRTQALNRLNVLGQAIFYEMFGACSDGIEDWSTVRLGDFIESGRIGLVRGADEQGQNRAVDYLRMDAIGVDGALDLTDLRRVDVTDLERSEYALLPGDLIFNTRNSRELVGKTAVVRETFSGVYNNNILRLRLALPMNSSFLDAYLRTPNGRAKLESIKSGTTSVFAIYQKSLVALEVPCPPSELQEQFADRLAALLRIRERMQSALEFENTLFSSLQHRAFRGEL